MDHSFFLLALSPLDGRYQSKVKSLSRYFSEFALIRYRVKVEIEWLIALAQEPGIDALAPFDPAFCAQLRKVVEDFSPAEAQKVKDFEATTNHDVKAVEYYINGKLKELGREDLSPMVHFTCTSEDINNLAYALMLKDAMVEEMIPSCQQVINEIWKKSEETRKVAMISRTHGQLASPTTMGKELYNVVARMERQVALLQKQSYLGKINGAVGNYNAHLVTYPKVDWKALSKHFVESLGLVWNPATTQIEPHDYMAEAFHALARFNTILLDFDRDIWAYISNEAFTQVPVAGEVGSSTMPHKVNPIDFENSEGNLGLANALLEHLAAKLPVSRWQRDLTDSTVLRNIGVAFGYSLLAYKSTLKGLGKLKVNQAKLLAELDASWAVLGEALQTVMRRYQIPGAYEKLKELTRGKEIDQEGLARFLDSLPQLPADERERLKQLRPSSYLGYAQDY